MSTQTRTGASLADRSADSRPIVLLDVDKSMCIVQTRRVLVNIPNPFRIAGELLRDEMIDRDAEAARLLALASGGHAARLVAPRRYGKTSLLRRVLTDASDSEWATALVDLEGVLSLSSVVVRIERAYDRSLRGAVRRTVDSLFRAWRIGLALGAGGFTASLQANPRIDVESVLLRLLDLPGEAPRAHGGQKLRRVRRVPGSPPGGRCRRDAAQRPPASDRRRVVRLRGLGPDADGAALRRSVAPAPRARRAGRARSPSPRRDRVVRRGSLSAHRDATSATRSIRCSRSPAGIRSARCSSRTTSGSSCRTARSATSRPSWMRAIARSRRRSPASARTVGVPRGERAARQPCARDAHAQPVRGRDASLSRPEEGQRRPRAWPG